VRNDPCRHDAPLWKPQLPRCGQQGDEVGIAAHDIFNAALLLVVIVHRPMVMCFARAVKPRAPWL
jgi:hypothetical protein